MTRRYPKKGEFFMFDGGLFRAETDVYVNSGGFKRYRVSVVGAAKGHFIENEDGTLNFGDTKEHFVTEEEAAYYLLTGELP